jgi:hypothetical protein
MWCTKKKSENRKNEKRLLATVEGVEGGYSHLQLDQEAFIY